MVRFCTTCGAPWQPEWAVCASCAALQQRQSVAAEIGAAVTKQRRSIISAVGLYGALLLVSAAGLIAAIAGDKRGSFDRLATEEIAMAIIILCWSVGSRGTLRQPLSRIGPLRWSAVSPLLALLTFAVATVAIRLMNTLPGMTEFDYLSIFTSAGQGFGVATLMIAVQPAVFEEIAFRGIVFNALYNVTGSGMETVLASAAMFAILHLSVPSFPHLFLMGAVLGLLRLRTGSLYPGMVLHFTHNLLCLLAERNGGIQLW
jgi:membrane protease YdiL (CAAX protease family)